MKRIRIKSIGDLEKFIQDERVTLENRLEVFTQTLENYPLFVFAVKYDDTSKIIENRESVLAAMIRTLNEIKADPSQKTYTGVWVSYHHNN
tara:strand:+ start:1539 stop:1811 length:273 start_codon:yes stop_codon:yes gene_type:complete